jgi:hypothetical protein
LFVFFKVFSCDYLIIYNRALSRTV